MLLMSLSESECIARYKSNGIDFIIEKQNNFYTEN